ncbi:hypothetical protein AaE_004856 [Aphanomyces astaci]|uniref:Cilia- and flagella-associated protein 36 n=1 Tax=Aphanomyces astaci TaxID=112090 RepID=A0A6A5AMT5_APHAT|nr:hypothetical protein AaE_004856 [Aphanomyces astaci]
MCDFLLDAVAQFLKGDQWLEPVNAFMHANKLAFVGLAGPQESYSLQQHAVFVEFKDLAERLLEGIVQDLGCEPSTFVAALEEAVVNEAGGPKEEEVQLLVKTLLAYDDFHGFCALMQTYVEWNAVPSMPPDENEMQFSGADEFQVVDGAAAFDATKYFGSHEWILQEVVARSLLDAQASGQLGDDDAAYLPWADAIMMMKAHYNNQTTVAAYDVSDGTGEATTTTIEVSTGAPTNALLSWRIAERQLALESKMAAKMRSLEATLVHERLKVDLLVAQRLSERNAGMRLQMSALCQQSFSGSDAAVDETTAGTTLSAEAELCHLCDRMETIQVELKAIKKRCFGFKYVSQAHLDEIYLFLKEKIHFKHDLAQCESEIADFIFSRIQPSDSAIVPDLLQWLLLESEAHEVQVEVQSRSFLSPRAEAKEVDLNDRWVQHWSGDDGTYYYLNSVTGESRWDSPMSKDGEPIVGYWDNDNQWVPYAFLAPGDNPPVDMTADSKGDVTPLEQKLPPLETKPWTPSADLTDIETALGSVQSTHRDFTSNMASS